MRVGWRDYGKCDIPVLCVDRRGAQEAIRQIDVTVRFEGDFADAYARGDNSGLLPTRTMTDTVYLFAKRHLGASLESFAIALTTHFLVAAPPAQLVELVVTEAPWSRLATDGGPDPVGFRQSGSDRRVTTVRHRRGEEPVVTSGCTGLYLMKTTGSSFVGFLHDDLTVLPDRPDRVLGAVLDVEWTYASTDVPFDTAWQAAFDAVVRAFSAHESRSTQHTLYVLATACLSTNAAIAQVETGIRHIDPALVDLAPLGEDNANEVYAMPHGAYGAAHLVVDRPA